MAKEFLSLVDWAKRTGPDGGISRRIVERMAIVDPIWEEIPFTKANDGWDHLITFRTKIPEPYWTAIGEGAPYSASQTDQVKEGIGFCEDWIQVPKRLAEKHGDKVEFMKSEAVAHAQGFSKVLERTLFYGNRNTDPKQFHGLSPRFNDLSMDNVLDAGGTGSNLTSLWLAVWRENTGYGIFPEEGQATVKLDKAKETETEDASGNLVQVYRQHLEWGGGLAIEDPRYFVRIANIDLSQDPATTNLDHLVIDASFIPPDLSGKAMWMANRQTIAYLVKVAKAQPNLALTWEEAYGRQIPNLWGVRLHKVEAILNTESQVV